MLAEVARWLAHYGYFGLAVGVLLESAGVPVPGETALLAAGVAAASGVLSLPLVVGVAALAGVLGDNLGYALGRRLGRPWLDLHAPWPLTPDRLARVDAFFALYGGAAVALARFVTGVRVVAAWSAGLARMRWRTFLTYNALGAVAWAMVVGVAGYAAGRGWRYLSAGIGSGGGALVALTPIALLAVWLLRWARHRRPGAGGRVGFPSIGWQWAWGVTVSLGATAVFAGVAEDVAEREPMGFDLTTRAWALAHHTPVLDAVFGMAAWAGSLAVVVPSAFLAGAWLWRRGSRPRAAPVLAAALASAGIVLLLKPIFRRAGPAGTPHPGALGYSFPSGPATAVTAVALTLAYVWSREVGGSWWALALAVTVALLVGASPVYLGMHWASDAIGGWSVGLLLATLCAALYERLGTAPRTRTPDAAAPPGSRG